MGNSKLTNCRRLCNPTENWGQGRIISYGACGIPYVLSGDIASAADLIHFTPESFENQRGIPVIINREATAVIGAGNIGLELVEALHRRGIKILLLDIAETPAAVWPPSIRRAIVAKLKEKEIFFSGKTTVNVVKRKGRSFVLETSSGQYSADILFSVVGTRPATEFCGSSLDTMSNGAIKIDRRGRTSAEDVYAAGDCASVFHQILERNVYSPLGSTANKMGRIAGLNMAGGSVEFPGIIGTQIFKFFELSLAKTGLSLEEAERENREAQVFSAERPDKAGYYPGAEKVSVEIVCEKDTQELIGATAICMGNAALFVDPAAVAIFSKMKASELAWFDFAYAPPYAPVWNALLSSALKAAKT